MNVTWDNFKGVMAKLSSPGERGVDCETSGLRLHHGDRLFSLIITDADETYYFNFNKYPDSEGVSDELVLAKELIPLLKPVFENPQSRWYGHKANFDQHALAAEGILIGGEIHCTKAIALVEYNAHGKGRYSLEDCAERIGEKKDDTVGAYIKEHKLTSKVTIPGKERVETVKHFDRVPFRLIVPYACADAQIARRLGKSQEASIDAQSQKLPATLPSIKNVFENEKRLTKTVFRMERQGLKVDLQYSQEAANYHRDRIVQATEEFLKLTGKPYSASPKLFAEVFADQKEKWAYTELGNPSFESETIEGFDSPVARAVVELRQAKSKCDFFNGFTYHADKNGYIHSTLNQDGAAHGRFSSSDPNLQNLSNSDEDGGKISEAYPVRRAFIPDEGFFLVSIDKKQMEYRLLLDVAGEMDLIAKIRDEGLDVHTAVSDEGTRRGAKLDRDMAKRVNFGLIYGQGDGLLAQNLKVSKAKAREIREIVLGVMPKVAQYNYQIQDTAARRGWIFNWFGRRCHFPDKNFAYRALNYAIAGGCADIMKIGLNRIDEFQEVRKTQSKLLWNVHDENIFKVRYGEEWVIEEYVRLMETSYPHRFLPQECSVSWSAKSLADLEDWSGDAGNQGSAREQNRQDVSSVSAH